MMGSLPDSRKLFTPLRIGTMHLSHRIIMSPLTRKRCPAGIPTPLVAEYYSQRATQGGLIISEGMHPSVMVRPVPPLPFPALRQEDIGGGRRLVGVKLELTLKKAGNMHGIPGMYTPEHIRGWKAVTDAVHAKGAYMACQLWHVSFPFPFPLASSHTPKLDID
jgi:N-ethylmaleimide reductase